MSIRALEAAMVAGVLLTVLVPQPSTANEPVRLVVQVNSPAASLSPAVRRLATSVQRLSYRAPRMYEADGATHKAEDLRRWYAVEAPASIIADLESELVSDTDVVSVRREYIYQQVAIPNDPQFSSQYGLQDSSTALGGINAPSAWNQTTGSSSTIIAIIDGGVDVTHEDLQSKVWVNDDAPGDGVDNDGNGFIDDTHGWDFIANRPAELAIHHATHVAGIAAASGNNGIGVAGVDWGARIMSIRVLGVGGGGGETNIIRGIEYAVANGAKVINLSIAGSSSSALATAIENAYAAGVVIVAAAGNSGVSTDFFSIYPVCADISGVNMVLGVGATDDEGEPANFSNYGKCVDVSAPGKSILSTKVGNNYGTMTGTSMSAPFAAGVAGLYIASHPNASPGEVINAITENADLFAGEDALGWNTEFKGKLNAAATVGAGSSASQNNSGSSNNQSSESSSESSGGDSGGGGGGDSGGGGGGGGGSEQAQSTPAPKKARVLGVTKLKPNLALIPKINAAFRVVFIHNPTVTEHAYWFGRVKRGEKRSFTELVGAMAWHKARGRTYVPSSR